MATGSIGGYRKVPGRGGLSWKAVPEHNKLRYGIDSYANWVKGDGVSIRQVYGIDLFSVARMGMKP